MAGATYSCNCPQGNCERNHGCVIIAIVLALSPSVPCHASSAHLSPCMTTGERNRLAKHWAQFKSLLRLGGDACSAFPKAWRYYETKITSILNSGQWVSQVGNMFCTLVPHGRMATTGSKKGLLARRNEAIGVRQSWVHRRRAVGSPPTAIPSAVRRLARPCEAGPKGVPCQAANGVPQSRSAGSAKARAVQSRDATRGCGCDPGSAPGDSGDVRAGVGVVRPWTVAYSGDFSHSFREEVGHRIRLEFGHLVRLKFGQVDAAVGR